MSDLGVVGMAVMGQNLALNAAEKGFRVSVYNRTGSKTDDTVRRAKDEGIATLSGYSAVRDFVQVCVCAENGEERIALQQKVDSFSSSRCARREW